MNKPGNRDAKKKILVISPWESVWSLGKGAGVSDDFYFIEKLSSRGFELHFLVPRGDFAAGLRFDNLTVHQYPNFFKPTGWWPTPLRRLLWPLLFGSIVTVRALWVGRSIRPDFILGHSHYGSLPSFFARLFLGVPSGVKLFGVMDLVHTEWPKPKYVFKNVEQIVALKIPQDVWIIVNDGTRGLAAALDLGVPQEKIRFIPNGINTEWFGRKYDRAGLRGVLGLAPDVVAVLFLARLVPSKRPELFIRALPMVFRRTRRPLIFLVAGDGSERRHCERLAVRLGVEEHVRFVGTIPHERVPEVMAASDVFVSTSSLTNMAIPTCEALLCGLPVVAFDVGDTRTVVRDGETGVVVRDGDTEGLAEAIAFLVNHEEKRKALGAQGMKFAANHFTSWDARTDMEVDIIEGILTKGDAT